MLANYTELQTEIADTLHRDDLTSKIPTFIKLFEHRANRLLNTPQQETTVNLTLSAGTSSVSLPSGFSEPVSVTLTAGDVIYPVDKVEGRLIDEITLISTVPGNYAIYNGALYFDALADQTYAVNLRYSSNFDLASTSANWLLTNHPDTYLYGSLAASAAYIGEDERLSLWTQLAGDAIAEIKRQGSVVRKTALITDLDGFETFDINRGY